MSDVDDTQTTVEAIEASAPVAPATIAPAPGAARRLDLDGIERDLADVELALTRLDNGAYWTDEITGEPLPDDLLADHPTTRRSADR